MMNRLEELWDSADDGASSSVGPLQIRGESEFDELLEAWYVERRKSIECEILLEESRKMIRHLLRESAVSPPRKKQALRLLRAIDDAQRLVDSVDDGSR